MDSYQNLSILENLYRMKALGYQYVDPIKPNVPSVSSTLPSSFEQLDVAIQQCHLCDLCKSRRQSMKGHGNRNASVMFVDFSVSAAEDETNQYYSGRSGGMLRDMIENVLGISVDEVFITHAVKCKPFGFQQPSQSECNSCFPYLSRQIELIKPSVIVALGADAYRIVANGAEDFESVRGEVIPYGESSLISIYHPNFLLRNPSFKRETLRDLQTIKGLLK